MTKNHGVVHEKEIDISMESGNNMSAESQALQVGIVKAAMVVIGEELDEGFLSLLCVS